jgi:hypothetical protein
MNMVHDEMATVKAFVLSMASPEVFNMTDHPIFALFMNARCSDG